MEEQKEIRIQHRYLQEKYTYYIIALCVTTVGFSIHLTFGLPLKWIQIPLGIAIGSWGGSIYFGLRFLNGEIRILFDNNEYFEILKGKNTEVGEDTENIRYATKIVEQLLREKSQSISKFSNWQYRLFSLGFISFLIWHIMEMYINTIN